MRGGRVSSLFSVKLLLLVPHRLGMSCYLMILCFWEGGQGMEAVRLLYHPYSSPCRAERSLEIRRREIGLIGLIALPQVQSGVRRLRVDACDFVHWLPDNLPRSHNGKVSTTVLGLSFLSIIGKTFGRTESLQT